MARDSGVCNERAAGRGTHGLRLSWLAKELRGRVFCAFALSATLAHGGCSMLPTAGPASAYVLSGQLDPESLPYNVVRITPEAELILASYSPRIGQVFEAARSGEIRFGIGDVVSVTLFENRPQAACSSRSKPASARAISLPFRTSRSIRTATLPFPMPATSRPRDAPSSRCKRPSQTRSRTVPSSRRRSLHSSTSGRRPSACSARSTLRPVSPVNANGERLLDAITRAGGPKNPGYDTFVTLERAGRQATAPFGALIHEPSNNIYVRPQDTIYVFTQPRTFLAFGASGQQGQFAFGAWRLSLAEAMAKAGGLKDEQADPASVFVYRGEPRHIAEQLGVDCPPVAGPIIPIIYHLNLRDPAGYFLATKFEMRNKDVVFASNDADGRDIQAPDVSASDHRHRQRSADGCRERIYGEQSGGGRNGQHCDRNRGDWPIRDEWRQGRTRPDECWGAHRRNAMLIGDVSRAR